MAAQALKDIKAFAASGNPPTHHGTEEREYGTALWKMMDGNGVRGPITYAENSFYEAYQNSSARASVAINMTPPSPYAIYFGTLHTHNPGSTLPSGHRDASGVLDGDQEVLSSTRNYLTSIGQNPNMARIYIAADALGPNNPLKIAIYNHVNADAAIGGAEGPEVDPEGQPCPPV